MALSFDDLIEEPSQNTGGVVGFDDLLSEPEDEIIPPILSFDDLKTVGKRAVGGLAGILPAAGDYLQAVPKAALQMGLQAAGQLMGDSASKAQQLSGEVVEERHPSFTEPLKKLPEGYREGAEDSAKTLMMPLEGISQAFSLPGKVVGGVTGNEDLAAGTDLAAGVGGFAFPFAKGVGKAQPPVLPEGAKEGPAFNKPITQKVGAPFFKKEIPANAGQQIGLTPVELDVKRAEELVQKEQIEQVQQESRYAQQTELPLNPTLNPYGVDTSKFIKDENGIPTNMSSETVSIGNQAELFGQNHPTLDTTPSPYAPLFDVQKGESVRNRQETPVSDPGIDYSKISEQTEMNVEPQFKNTPFDPSSATEAVGPNTEAVTAFWRKAIEDKGIDYPGLPEAIKGQLETDLKESIQHAEMETKSVAETVKEIQQKVDELPKTLGGVGKKGFGQGGAVGFFKKPPKPPSYEEFKKTLESHAGRQFSDNVARQVYLERHEEAISKAAIDKKAVAQAVSKIPGLKKSADVPYTRPNLVQKFTTPIGTLMLNIHPEIGQRYYGLEKDIRVKSAERMHEVDELLVNVNKSQPEAKRLIDDALLDNDFDLIDSVTEKSPRVREQFDRLKKVISGIGKELREAKVLDGLRENYFPRTVKDYKGLLKAIGVKEKIALQEKIREATAKGADDVEIAKIINKHLGFTQKSKKPGFAKERVFDKVPEHLKKFYATPTEAMHSYIKSATERIEVAKFFGENLAKDAEGKIDINGSIGKLVNDLASSGKLSEETLSNKGLEDLADMLQARFANKAASPFFKNAKNVSVMAVMGDFANTVMQAADIQSTIRQAGPLNTAKAVYILTKGKNIPSKFARSRDLGLLDHYSEEFAGEKGTDLAVKHLFKHTSLSRLDSIMKSVNLVANRLANEARVSDPNSRLYRVYAERFGDRFPQLLEDFRSEKRTPLTDELLWSELHKVQPISKASHAIKRLNDPDLVGSASNIKSFFMVFVDDFINETYKEIQKGNTKAGLKNLLAFITISGTITAGVQDFVDLLRNRPLSYKGELSDIPMAFLKNIGLSSYFTDKFGKNPVTAVGDLLAPPVGWTKDVVDDVSYGADKLLDKAYGKDVFMDNATNKFKGKSIKMVPFVGDEIYGWMTPMGEEEKRKLEKQEKTKGVKQGQMQRRLTPEWMK